MLIKFEGKALELWQQWMEHYANNNIQVTATERTEAFFAVKDGRCPNCHKCGCQ